VTLNSLQFNAARAFGPAIAGLILEAFGASWAFLLNGISFVFVLVALLLVKVRVPARTTPLSGTIRAQFARAVRYTRTQPGIVIGMVVAVLVGALGNPIQQFTVIFAEDIFEVNALRLGILNVALGLGAVLAAPLVSGWDQIISRGTLVRIALPVYGAAVAAFALSPGYWFGLVALTVVGAGFLTVISTTNTAVQVIVADRVRGRVLAFRIMAFTGAYPIGALVQGYIADVIGPRPTVASAGLILAAIGVYMGVIRPNLLGSLDDPHDDSPSPSAAVPV
jgi:MFS family permease